tara:strand:- start:641 stop:985 length:345 start_codon:yes stop_codon:yes gene_type:complete
MITLCKTEGIKEGTSKGFEVNGTFLFAVKKDEQLHLYHNRCPHLGTPLEWEEDRFLEDDGALIRCATHGALFEIDNGLCLVGPCKGKTLHAIAFEIQEGELVIDESRLKHPMAF